MKRPHNSSSGSYSTEVWNRLSNYQAEGLIPQDFQPNGEHEHEQLGSIEAKAYVAWLRINHESLSGTSPEDARSRFLNRNNSPT